MDRHEADAIKREILRTRLSRRRDPGEFPPTGTPCFAGEMQFPHSVCHTGRGEPCPFMTRESSSSYRLGDCTLVGQTTWDLATKLAELEMDEVIGG